jgi:phosphatidylserine/phosphatidylglycerophosphate/cardiolipin synthase-like enzyme
VFSFAAPGVIEAMATTKFQVTGSNAKAPFTLKVHRGDGMALLAMNWRKGKPPRNFVGFSIEFREPGESQFWPLLNSLGFPGERTKFTDPPIDSTRAPFQKFRWVHFPGTAEKKGEFTYRVTPCFMDAGGTLSRGEPQTAAIALMRDTHPGKLNVAFTRGFVSSQAFVRRFAPDAKLSTLLPDVNKKGLDFTPTHKKADEAYEWMGFEARAAICELLDQAIANPKAQVRAIAFDLNLPEIVTRLEQLKGRLKIIVDDSDDHETPTDPESVSAARLAQTAGAANVVRQQMGNLQHHKSIAVRGGGISKVLYGSTNFTWRGFYVQSNNAVIINSKKAADDYFDAFDDYFGAADAAAFKATAASAGFKPLGIPGLDARVGFSPHNTKNRLLDDVGKDIGTARSCVLFSLAFLGLMTKGPIGPALGKQIQSTTVHTLGIADASVKEKNLGVAVLSPDHKRRIVRSSALTSNVPAPFATEPSGLPGKNANERGTRMHHKFVVIDFDRPDARVYFGSYNFSEPADGSNGENLLLVKDRTVATSYMIEAVRLYEHYRLRAARAEAKGKGQKVLELKRPPKKASDKPWWQRFWDDPIRKRDRELFA